MKPWNKIDERSESTRTRKNMKKDFQIGGHSDWSLEAGQVWGEDAFRCHPPRLPPVAHPRSKVDARVRSGAVKSGAFDFTGLFAALKAQAHDRRSTPVRRRETSEMIEIQPTKPPGRPGYISRPGIDARGGFHRNAPRNEDHESKRAT
jgi:hypothetical protein